MRYLFLFMLALALSGCLPAGSLNPPERKAREAFLQGFEAWTDSGSTDSWEPLLRDYPESSWATHARHLADQTASMAQQQETMSALEAKSKRLAAETDRCKQENKRLQQDINLLNENIDQLKRLLVDYELRAK